MSKVLHSYVAQRVSNPDDAEDLARDILLKACVALENLRSPGCFWSLLFQIAGNSVSDYWRRQYRATENRVEVEDPRPFEELAAEVIERCLVHAALGDLSPEDQEVVRLHYFEELSSSELGSRLGTSAAAARQRLSRAKRRLRQQLERRGIGRASERDGL
ncbi:MAG: sigma-70 family RNA polymerase sigma factor [Armatimonadetes bacterium]|nr:sigma-70 family RNA polymerase sigma factor [Armatimonadota bacterium]